MEVEIVKDKGATIDILSGLFHFQKRNGAFDMKAIHHQLWLVVATIKCLLLEGGLELALGQAAK